MRVVAQVAVGPARPKLGFGRVVVLLDQVDVVVALGLVVRLDDVVLDQPVASVALLPRVVHVFGAGGVVVLGKREVLITGLFGGGADDTVVDEPVVEVAVAVSLVRCVDGGRVGILHLAKQIIASSLGFGLNDALLLEVRAEVVVVPGRVDVVGAVIESTVNAWDACA